MNLKYLVLAVFALATSIAFANESFSPANVDLDDTSLDGYSSCSLGRKSCSNGMELTYCAVECTGKERAVCRRGDCGGSLWAGGAYGYVDNDCSCVWGW